MSQVKASDLVRYSKKDDLLLSSQLDIKKLTSKRTKANEGWYEFDVTSAVVRWMKSDPKKTRLMVEASVEGAGRFMDAYLLVFTESDRHKLSR